MVETDLSNRTQDGRRYPSYVFIEQAVAMLCIVLLSKMAIGYIWGDAPS